MAGNYMDAPASRVAYDRDGSIGFGLNVVGSHSMLTLTNLIEMNGEAESGFATNTRSKIGFVFPIPMDLSAVFLAYSAATSWTIETSVDTTTGSDGTWVTNVAAAATYLRDVKPNYRIAAQNTPLASGPASLGVRGIRISTTANVSGTIRAFHIYGEPSSTATQQRIAFWHPTSNAEASPAYLDWGNVPRSSSADRTFRVKNLSGVLTAQGVEVYVDALTPGTPSVAGMHLLSLDGVSFAPSVALGNLAPGAISAVVTLRRVVPSNASVSVWSARIIADVTSWTEI